MILSNMVAFQKLLSLLILLNHQYIASSVCINTEGYFLEWYFDIAKDSALTENGVPYIDDLYLDVILTPEGKIKMIDQEELQDAIVLMIISIIKKSGEKII